MKRTDIHRHEDYVERVDKTTSQAFVPLSCPYGCGKTVNRSDLEVHAQAQHGQVPVPKRERRRKGTGPDQPRLL